MEKEELLKELNKCFEDIDEQGRDERHRSADSLLLNFIDDKEITEAFDKIEKWYS